VKQGSSDPPPAPLGTVGKTLLGACLIVLPRLLLILFSRAIGGCPSGQVVPRRIADFWEVPR
jgi:hypothetical protein